MISIFILYLQQWITWKHNIEREQSRLKIIKFGNIKQYYILFIDTYLEKSIKKKKKKTGQKDTKLLRLVALEKE